MLDEIFREQAQPAFTSGPILPIHRIAEPGDHQSSGQVQVVDGQGVADGFVDQTLSLEPGSGPAVELSHLLRTGFAQQSPLEQFLEQVVIAVPMP